MDKYFKIIVGLALVVSISTKAQAQQPTSCSTSNILSNGHTQAHIPLKSMMKKVERNAISFRLVTLTRLAM